MPVRLIFRCRFCDAEPDAPTQRALELQVREVLFGEYRDALPGNWLVWHGRGHYGRREYACPRHRGELTAYLRRTFGTLGDHPWKKGPYLPTTRAHVPTSMAHIDPRIDSFHLPQRRGET